MEQEILKRRTVELKSKAGLWDAEELLKLEKASLDLLDSAPEAILLADKDCRIVWVNPQFTSMFGFSFEEAVGKTADDLIALGEKHPEASCITGRVHSGEQVRFESTRFRKNGTVVYVEGMAVPVRSQDRQIGVFVSYRDITERKKAEAALREAEERYRSLFENSPVGIGIASTDGRILDNNKAILKPGGYEQQDIRKDRRISDFYYDAGVREKILEETKKHGFLDNCEVRFKRKDGTPYDALLSLRPVKIKGESSWYAIVQDITEQKKAEKAAKESQGKYRDLVENANSIVLRWDTRGRILYMNRFGLEFFGYSEKEIVGRNALGTIIPEKESATGRDLRKLMAEIQADPDQFKNNEHENMRKNGQRAWVLWTNKAILDEQGNIEEVLSIGNDVTEKRNLQTQLIHAQKMEAIGTLAGGIAHDFNNLLMGIQGRVSLMLLECGTSNRSFQDHLRSIEEHVESAADLTRQLLGFARGGKYQQKPSDLNAVLRKSSEMFGRTRKEIAIHSRYQQEIWTVEVDRGQIEQVFINLFVNAWQSMPGGGELFLSTENVYSSGLTSKALGLRAGRYVKVSIRDTGEGMDERTRDRVFDPFFTTKGMGRGTGLGLASAYGIIKNHGGIIQVESQKGRGSSFHIYLPASEKEMAEEKVDREEILRGSETVLLVDDEEMILEVGLKMLIMLGYKVLTARSGREAADLYREKGKIDLVILDMIMPGVGGKETFEELKKIDPDVRVLLSSGYSIDNRAKSILEGGCRGFIQKPFNLSALSWKLRELLES